MKEIFDKIVYIETRTKWQSYCEWSRNINQRLDDGSLLAVDFSSPKQLTLEIVEIATSYSKTPQLRAKDLATGHVYLFMGDNMMKLISQAVCGVATVAVEAKRKGTAKNCYYYQMAVQ